ncbi:insulinase family protein [Candidatus Babeliales bacterium]|nr:insulinase family protein [Candidatus Babeliales bacterium]
MKKKQIFTVHKKKLANGLSVLVRPTHATPEVAVQIWYNVGSKDEQAKEYGMAHLIEHMIFKGTKKLSERDIDLITYKLSGSANAFTSNDYTAYVFRFPNNVWEKALMIFADCMKNARFDEQMLRSELQAVIQEMKLYKDDYQSVLLEKMMSGMFMGHPYQHPIIGYKHDLFDLKRDDLHAFYKKHYHPGNATLVVVGDVKRDDVFQTAEKFFGKIRPVPDYEKEKHFFLNDVFQSSIRLPREVETPWAFYSYAIPGFEEGNTHLFDMIEFLAGNGRSSRLYEKLVNQTKLATTVGCFTYDLFKKGLFVIYVQPKNMASLARIEQIINQELLRISSGTIEEWEFEGMKKRAQMSCYRLLEDIELQAELIGSAYLATGDANYLDHYLENIRKTKRTELKKEIKKYLLPALQHKGFLVSANDEEKKVWHEFQLKSDAVDQKVLEENKRKTKVEPAKYASKVKEKKLPDFTYPKPKTFILDNGLEVLYHHNPTVPKLSVLLGLKANYLHEPEEIGGMSTFMGRLFLEGTKKRSGRELNQFLESHSMNLSASSGLLGLEMLSCDFEKGLDVLQEVITQPAFEVSAIEKVRQQILVELAEYWDTPTLFVDQLARQAVYGGHPYAKNRLGYKECVKQFSKKSILDFYNNYVSPQESVLVIVGDLSGYIESRFEKIVKKYFGSWKGKQIQDILLPEILYKKPKVISHQINRDQVVLAFAAPSISRLDKNYDAMALLDVILTGGGTSMSSRLFQLREQTGLFYSIGGSLLHGAQKAPGMMFIKTLVSLNDVELAEKLIKKEVEKLREKGVQAYELQAAANALIVASVGSFESSNNISQLFLFFRRCGLSFDLFDKRGAFLSILNMDTVNTVARRYCKENLLSTIRVGRITG